MFGKRKPSTEPIIKEYRGTLAQATKLFMEDAENLADKGYLPVSEEYTPGRRSFGDFFVALLLCFFLIGIIIFIYMVIVKPSGVLVVVYQYQHQSAAELTKTCPDCAETVKEAAKICRYCGHEFDIYADVFLKRGSSPKRIS